MKAERPLRLPRHDPNWDPRELADRSVLLVGLGSFGGGIGAARWLLERGARLTVTDLRDEDSLGPVVEELRLRGARLVLGRHDESDLKDCDTCNPFFQNFPKLSHTFNVPLWAVLDADRIACVIEIAFTQNPSSWDAWIRNLC